MPKIRTKFRFTTRDLGAGTARQLLRHKNQAMAAMRAVRNMLIKETKRRTPLKEGFLTASVTGDVEVFEKSYAATVYIPVNSPASHYAVKMHETEYNLGKNSLAKQAKVGVTVGPKYITRAVQDNRQKICECIWAALDKANKI